MRKAKKVDDDDKVSVYTQVRNFSRSLTVRSFPTFPPSIAYRWFSFT